MGSQSQASSAPALAMEAPHVVIVPNPSSGHTIPFLQFAHRLAAAGVVTTFVTSDKQHQELQLSLGTTDLTPQGKPLRLLPLHDATSLNLSHKDWHVRLRNDRSEELRMIHRLQSAIADMSSPPPVCILHDMFETWAQEVADNLQIAKHLLYVSPAGALSCALQSNRMFEEGRIPITRETREAVFDDIPGLPKVSALDLPTPFLDAALYEWMRFRHARFGSADIILLNTFYELEKPVLDALRRDVIGASYMKTTSILDVGPLLPDSYINEMGPDLHPDLDPCIQWLNERGSNSVLYVSFGSVATHSADQLLELAEGLEASGVSFLWIVRAPNADKRAEGQGIEEFLPAGFEDRVRERGMCYSGWAPQMRILKHPAVGGFLSHCGWNSTLETVVAGVPVLAWPKHAEQCLNRRLLVDTAKVAVELNPKPYTAEELASEVVNPVRFVSKEEIQAKARNLMHGAEGRAVRENVRQLRAKACEAGAPGGSSRRSFDAYVRLLHDYRRSPAPSQPRLPAKTMILGHTLWPASTKMNREGGGKKKTVPSVIL